jgi:hypothetical protein
VTCRGSVALRQRDRNASGCDGFPPPDARQRQRPGDPEGTYFADVPRSYRPCRATIGTTSSPRVFDLAPWGLRTTGLRGITSLFEVCDPREQFGDLLGCGWRFVLDYPTEPVS